MFIYVVSFAFVLMIARPATFNRPCPSGDDRLCFLERTFDQFRGHPVPNPTQDFHVGTCWLWNYADPSNVPVSAAPHTRTINQKQRCRWRLSRVGINKSVRLANVDIVGRGPSPACSYQIFVPKYFEKNGEGKGKRNDAMFNHFMLCSYECVRAIIWSCWAHTSRWLEYSSLFSKLQQRVS